MYQILPELCIVISTKQFKNNAKLYSESCLASKTELFTIIVTTFHQLTIFVKSSVLKVWGSFEFLCNAPIMLELVTWFTTDIQLVPKCGNIGHKWVNIQLMLTKFDYLQYFQGFQVFQQYLSFHLHHQDRWDLEILLVLRVPVLLVVR